MFFDLIQECRRAIGEHALDPDLHRNSVKALENEKRGEIPDLRRMDKRRGRKTDRPQVMTPRGWKDVEEYGSQGRTFSDY